MNTHTLEFDNGDDDSTRSIKSRIADTEVLVRNLTYALESSGQQIKAIENDMRSLRSKLYPCSDVNLRERMKELLKLISYFDEIPSHLQFDQSSNLDPDLLPPTAKKLGFQFRHNSKNKGLAAERKMIRMLQDDEKEFVQKPKTSTLNINFSDKQLKSLIKEWANKIEYVGNLMLDDSRNLDMRWESYQELANLRNIVIKTFWNFTHIDQQRFNQGWRSMKDKKSSIEMIRLDAIKAWKRHKKKYEQFEKSYKEEMEMLKLKLTHEENQRRYLGYQKVLAYKLLLDLRIEEKKEQVVQTKAINERAKQQQQQQNPNIS